jgi:hypothetical protein
MTECRFFSDRYLRALAPAPPGQLIEARDARLPGFRIIVTDLEDANPARRGKAGKVTFVLYARFARGKSPTSRFRPVFGP